MSTRPENSNSTTLGHAEHPQELVELIAECPFRSDYGSLNDGRLGSG